MLGKWLGNDVRKIKGAPGAAQNPKTKEKAMKSLNFDLDTMDFSDILDRITLHRRAVGFVADRIEDQQASANLHLIELAIEDTEQWLQILINKGIEQEVAVSQDVPFD